MDSKGGERRRINWPQLIGTALAVCMPLIAFAMQINARLAVIEDRVTSHTHGFGHQPTVDRLTALERQVDRADQWKEDVLRRLEEQNLLLREMNARLLRAERRQ